MNKENLQLKRKQFNFGQPLLLFLKTLRIPYNSIKNHCYLDAITKSSVDKYQMLLSFGRLGEVDSVAGIVARDLQDVIPCDAYNFVSCGREDMNALMLGDGRPCVFELKCPRRVSIKQDEIDKIQKNINEKQKYIQISKLRVVDDEYFTRLKKKLRKKIKVIGVWSMFIQRKEMISINS
eukprot:UN25398